MEKRRPKMARFHRETKKKQIEVCDRQTESIVDNNDSQARRADQNTNITAATTKLARLYLQLNK